MKGSHRSNITILITLLYISWSTQDESDAAAGNLADAPNQVAHVVNEFGHKLMLNMMKENVDKNLVISPTGIAGLLAMALLGSVGPTYNELAKVLGFSDFQDILENRQRHEEFGVLLQNFMAYSDAPVKVEEISTSEVNNNETFYGLPDANSTMVPETNDSLARTVYADVIVVDAKTRIRNTYLDFLHRVYHGDTISARFEDAAMTRHLINEWVRNHTGGKIEEFLTDPLPASTKMVLLSALFFSGQWAQPFIPEHTRNMTFHKPSENVVAELMLNSGGFKYVSEPKRDVHMIAFPYNDNTTTMYVLKRLSYHKKTTLPEIMEQLDYSSIERLIQKMTDHQCVVRFPKMDFSTKVDLQSALKKLGINSAFTPGDANFALMVDADGSHDDIRVRIQETRNDTKKIRDLLNSLRNPGLYVDSVLHEVKMTVNEYGTVAVAATSAFMSRTATAFYADSPFYMFIRNEETKLITFSAVIFDPTDT